MALKNPILSNPIAVDIPKLNEILDALSKANPTDVDGISTGAVRLYEVSSGKWQWQVYNGSTWASVPFLQHNVDQLDGYHAAITPAENTVAVRNASGLLQDSITGNAATASSAATLSQTLPVAKGGTGATTSEAARSNLGVPPTSHASTNTTHGVGNATQYGHLKLSDAANSSSGVSGGVAATPAAVKAAKDAADAAQSSADAAMTKASTLATASAAGIVKPGAGMTVDAAGALNVDISDASTPGIVKSSTIALAGAVPLASNDGKIDASWVPVQDSLAPWIGVPRYWRSTTLPANHCWANGDFIEFADWPELKQVYNAGGFEGMLLPWNANSNQQAANLGKWRPDAPTPTGLYTPNLSGLFIRGWTSGSSNQAGTYETDQMRAIKGTNNLYAVMISEAVTGCYQIRETWSINSVASGYRTHATASINTALLGEHFSGDTTHPENISQPIVIYLGKPA